MKGGSESCNKINYLHWKNTCVHIFYSYFKVGLKDLCTKWSLEKWRITCTRESTRITGKFRQESQHAHQYFWFWKTPKIWVWGDPFLQKLRTIIFQHAHDILSVLEGPDKALDKQTNVILDIDYYISPEINSLSLLGYDNAEVDIDKENEDSDSDIDIDLLIVIAFDRILKMFSY